MAHDTVYGFCENKCKVEVPPKTVVDGLLTDVAALEGVSNGGAIKSKSITNSGTITSTGKITANGGIAGNLTGNVTGNVTGFLYIKGTVGTSGDVNYATLAAQKPAVGVYHDSDPLNLKINNYSIVFGNPQKVSHGIYCKRSDLTGTTSPSVSTRTLRVRKAKESEITYNPDNKTLASSGYVYWKYSDQSSWTRFMGPGLSDTDYTSITVAVGKTVQIYASNGSSKPPIVVEVTAGTTYKVKYATP